MNRKELVDEVASRAGMSRQAAESGVRAMIEAIQDALARGGDVRLAGFGTLGSKHVPARKGRRPGTKDEIDIPERTKVVFKPAKALQEAVA